MTGLTLFVLPAVLLSSSLALADVIPPDVDAYRDKKLGDVCKVEQASPKISGTCQMGQHCSLKYSGCDSSGPCGTTCKDTLKCKEGSGSGTGTGTGGGETEDSGGCSLASLGIPWQSAGVLLAGVLLVLGLRRRN